MAKVLLYETPYVAAPVRETGDVIARTPLYPQISYICTYKSQSIFLVHK